MKRKDNLLNGYNQLAVGNLFQDNHGLQK